MTRLVVIALLVAGCGPGDDTPPPDAPPASCDVAIVCENQRVEDAIAAEDLEAWRDACEELVAENECATWACEAACR